MINKLSIIIPVYNEIIYFEQSLKEIIELKIINNIKKEIIIIDDFSTDGTIEKIKNYEVNKDIEVKKIFHNVNQGKGMAIRSGLKQMTGDYMIIRDADLEYIAQDINTLVNEVLINKADVVYGSRFLTAGSHRVLFFWHMIGNKFLTLLSNMINGLNFTDMETCYKLISKKVLDNINLYENRFGFEPEITAKIAHLHKRKNLKIYEVGISYNGRTYDEGKKINWKDGFAAIKCIIIYGIFRGK
jgi:glycosyltransferase involved in cell wall biosynthesis